MNSRFPWQDFPPVHIMTPLGTASKHSSYSAAKQDANSDAAFELVNDILPDEKVYELQLGDKKPVIVPVHAKEAEGTNASLRGYIEGKGGQVIMATALTGYPGAASINITYKMLRKLQEKHGDELNSWWKEQFGFGIESLTQGEAGHLAKAPTLDAIRDRIAEARFEGQHGISR